MNDVGGMISQQQWAYLGMYTVSSLPRTQIDESLEHGQDIDGQRSLQAQQACNNGEIDVRELQLQAQQATLSRIGMGGLGEAATFAEAEAGSSGQYEGIERRGDAGGVAHADVIHKASEAEQILQLLLQQLRNLPRLKPADGVPQDCLDN